MKLELLDSGQIRHLQDATLQLLGKIGVRIEHSEARQRMLRAGCKVDGERVRIPSELVQQCIAQAPQSFKLFGSRGDHEYEVGGKHLLAMTLGCAPQVFDAAQGQCRASTSDDLVMAARVADWANHVHVFPALVGLSDAPGSLSEVMEYVLTVRNYAKPFSASIYSAAGVRYITEMAAEVAGGLDELQRRPTVLYSVCPISPLRFTSEVTAAIIQVAEYRMPLSIVPMPVLGVSAPITLSGALVQQNAENLAGLVLAYQYASGVPVMINSLISSANMHTATSVWGAPEIGLGGAYTAELARSYGIPCKVYGFATSSKRLDLQNGMERALNALMGSLPGPSMIGGLGGYADLMVASLEQLVIDNEIMGRILTYQSDLAINEETLALAEIREAMEGKSYLTQRHTVRQLRSGALWMPDVSDFDPRDGQDLADNQVLVKSVQERVRQILEEHQVEPLAAGVESELDRLLEKAKAELVD